jgi:uncharacterized protein (TIGR00270 family)
MVEGVAMNVCKNCSSYGTPIKRPRPVRRAAAQQSDDMEFVDTHYGQIIKKKRESMGMRQKDLARFLNERESLIHQLESGHMKPSQQLIKKLKQKMDIDLLRQAKEEDIEIERKDAKATLGDFIKK